MSETFTLTDLRNAAGDEFSLEELKPKAYDVPAGVQSAMNIGQSLSFGFGDEIAGALGADKDRYRATIDQFRKEYPKSALLGSVAGSMALPFGAAKVAANPWATAATIGGASGALQAAGDAEKVSDIPGDASKAALFGMAAGPLMLGGTQAVGGVAAALGNQAATRVPGLKEPLINALARNRVANAFNRDEVQADDVAALMQRMGPEARVADAAGDSTRSLLDINATLPGKTKTALEQAIDFRIAGRPERMDPIVNTVSGGQGRAGDVFQTWQTQKETAAGPLYARFYSKPVTADRKLQELLNVAENNGLFKMAAERASFDQHPFTLTSAKTAGGSYEPRDLDYVKRALDARIAQALQKEDGDLARTLTGYKTKLVSAIDEASGNTYKPALDAFSGPASLQTAMANGRRFLSSDAESLGMELGSLSQAEREAFKIGAAESLRQKFGGQAGQTEFLNAWKNRNVREKLQVLLGDDVKYSDVMQILNNERTLKKLEGVGRGSQTASRLAAGEDQTMGVAGDMVQMVGQAKAGMWPTLLGNIGEKSQQLGTPEPVRDAIGKILLQQQAVEELRRIQAAQKAMKARSAFTGGAAGMAAGQVPGMFPSVFK